MGDQVSGTRPASGTPGDQHAVLRKLAGRLDDLSTGDAPRLIRPGEAGYGDGPAMPHIDPDAYRAETGKEWVPTEVPAASAAAPAQATPAKPAAPKQPQVQQPGQKAQPQAKKAGPKQGQKPQPKAKQQTRPAQQKGQQRPNQAQKPRPPQGKVQASGKPQAQAKARPATKQPGFWARLWAKLTGRG